MAKLYLTWEQFDRDTTKLADLIPGKQFSIYFGTNDPDFLKLITGLLEPNPYKRYTSQTALSSRWLVK